jgi:hypothetical protein
LLEIVNLKNACWWKTPVEKAENSKQNQVCAKLFHRRSFLPFHKPTGGAWWQKQEVLKENLCKTQSKSTTFPQVLKSVWKTHTPVWKT